jgi:NADH dehydrogenase
MGLVVDLGPRHAVANPLGMQLSGFPAKFVTRAYHLYAIPRTVNRWAVSLAYLTMPYSTGRWYRSGLPRQTTPILQQAKASDRRHTPLVFSSGGCSGR